MQDLEERLREQGRLLAERDFLIARLRSDLEEAAKLENDLRAEIENAGGRNSSAVDKFRADIEQLEAQLAAAIEDRSRLQREVSAMKRDAETTWAAERVENALLRERINDVAAEVARLTAVLEGPGSPIETILAQAVPERGQARGARRAELQRHKRGRRRPRQGHARRRQGLARRPHPRFADHRLARGVLIRHRSSRRSAPAWRAS